MSKLYRIGLFLMLSAIYLRIITENDSLQMIAMAMVFSGGILLLLDIGD